jgi:hypothetical protein
MIDVEDYLDFKGLIDLGFNVDQKEYPFEKIMVFSWVREALENGRKN